MVSIYDSYKIFSKAAKFYHYIQDDELAVLDWIKYNTNLDDIIIASQPISDWIFALLGRKTMAIEMTSQYMSKSVGYIPEEEIQHTADIITSGEYLLENGNIRVADDFRLSMNIGIYQLFLYVIDYINYSKSGKD